MQYLRPTYQESFSTLKIVCSNWHHLVGTYNNGVWSIYVDGVLESSYTSVSPGTFAGFSHPIYIGRSASGSNAVGRMKEVSLWNYAKPPSQIQAEFKTKYTGNETGLEGYWKLDVSGSTALDLSPNNRTMTAYSVIWNTHNDFTRTFTADKKSHSDYYPFGMQMPGRTGTPSEYSYGFQGMEHLDGANGFGNEYTTEYRQYDPRLGRWTSVDPLAHEFPGMSPYVAFNNNPILYTDPDGQAAINWCNVGYAIKQGASFVANNAGAFMASQAIEMGMMGNGGVDFNVSSPPGEYKDVKTGETLGSDGVDDGLEHKIDRKDFEENYSAAIRPSENKRNLSDYTKDTKVKDGNLYYQYQKSKWELTMNFTSWMFTGIGEFAYSSRTVGLGRFRLNTNLEFWTGKNGKINWGHTGRGPNQYTGSRFAASKFARPFKFLGQTMGYINYMPLLYDWGVGNIDNYDFTVEFTSNTISTFGGLYGVAWGMGWEAGRGITKLDSYQYLKKNYWLPYRKLTLGY